MKSDLGLHPIYHQLGCRVEARVPRAACRSRWRTACRRWSRVWRLEPSSRRSLRCKCWMWRFALRTADVWWCRAIRSPRRNRDSCCIGSSRSSARRHQRRPPV